MASLISWAKRGLHDVTHNPVTNLASSAPVRQVEAGLGQKFQQAQVPQALSFVQRNIVQPFGHAVGEIPATLSNHTLTPPTAFRPLTGSQPIKPVQADVRGVYRAVQAGNQHLPGGIPIPRNLAAPYAAADAVVHAAQDLPLVGGAIKGLSTAAKDVSKVVPALQPLDQSGKLRLPSLGGQNLHYSSNDGITKISGKANAVRAQLKALNENGGINNKPSPALPPKPPKTPSTPSGVPTKLQQGSVQNLNKAEIVYRSESPNRYGIGQSELGSGLYTGSKETAGRMQNGKIVTDGLHEYKVNPSAKILDSSSETFKKIDSQASNHPSLKGLEGRQWQQTKGNIVSQLVKDQGFDGVRRGTNQVVAMSDKALIPITKDAPVYSSERPNLNKDAFSNADIAKMNKEIATQNKAVKARQVTQPTAGLGPVSKDIKDQLKAPQFKRTAPENTQLNPTKVTIPEVQPGNYEQARINPQLASNPIDFATSQAVKAAQRLSKAEQKNIPHLVENPSLATSKAAKEFVARHNQLTNLTHATSQGLGGNTNFVPNYFRHAVDLAKPEDAARWEKLVNERGGAAADPYAFGGVDNMNRVFENVKDLQSAGFHLKNENNPIQNIIDYGKSSSATLKRQALVKGFTEADMTAGPKLNNFDLHNGNVIPLSDRGIQEIQGYKPAEKVNAVHSGYRAVNRKVKQGVLSVSEFHPLNIGPKVSGTLLARGHGIKAAEGLYGTFRSQLGRKYSDKLQQSYATKPLTATIGDGQAAKVTTVEAGARLGTPLKFGSDYANEGKLELGKAGFGEKTIFEESMPALHGRAVQAAVKDLNKKGLSLDSPEAHALGTRINELMGFVNTEVRNLNQGRQRGLSDIAFAPQFTRSKWATLKSALKDTRFNNKSLAGSYARRAVLANAATDFVFMAGVGYLVKQKSDDARDLLLRAIFNPAVPTPWKDSKGNTINLRTPASYSSEALGLVVTLERGKDGHLTPKFEPSKIGGLHGTVASYGRNRLAVVPSNVLKVVSNENYAGKLLYDPNAKFGTKVEQGATTIGSGLLPIGGQGIPQTDFVKKHLPGNVQDVLNANQPGSNPLLKSVGSSFGLTPTTDKTVGKGLQTDQYFSALADAKKGLNSHEKDALDLYAGSKKNPVTGKYDVKPNANDTQAKARALLDQPKVIDNLIIMNAKLKSQGQKGDPLWQQSKDKITSVLQYQAMPPGGPDRTHWQTQNGDWYNPLSKQRTAFFNSLPKGDPNKPQAPIQYPNASPDVAAKQEQFFNLTDGKQRSQFLQENPDVQKQLDAQVEYNNKMRVATGYGALDTFPKASASTQKIIDTYNAIPKGGGKKGGNLYRSQWIQAHPNEYAAMQQYFTQSSLYGLQKDAGQAAFKDTGFSSKGLGDIYNLGKYDIGKQTDANGNTFYTLGQGGQNGSSGGYGSYARKPKFSTTGIKTAKIKKFSVPKGVKVKKLAYKPVKTKKLSVSKIPKIA